MIGGRAHIHVKLRSDACGVCTRAWIERPGAGEVALPAMLTIEATRRDLVASVLGWALPLARVPAP
jgi:hypothetical protein